MFSVLQSRNSLKILGLSVLEIAFIVVFLFTYVQFHFAIVEVLGDITDRASSSMDVLEGSRDDNQIWQAYQEQEIIKGLMGKAIWMTIGMIASLYVIWSLFQGFIFAQLGKTARLMVYLKRFWVVSLASIVALSLVVLLFFRVMVYNSMELYALIPQGVIGTVFIILVLGIWYATYEAYLMIRKKHLEKIRFTHYVPFFIALGAYGLLLAGFYLVFAFNAMLALFYFLLYAPASIMIKKYVLAV